jgi:G2/mitotic-specific cyclin-B, other
MYINMQEEINEKIRSVLVDWIISVHLKFKLWPETLYLTINLIDRYLSIYQVSKSEI